MKRTKELGLIVLMLVACVGAMAGAQKAAAKKIRVFFIEPKNNASVTSPVHMKFGSRRASKSRRFPLAT